jgi:UDP-N-acetyl-D-glucosamine dehydrogenase
LVAFYLNGGSVKEKKIYKTDKKICVCVQGIGFVGAAMMAVLSSIKNKKTGDYLYDIIGIDQDTIEGNNRIKAINEGSFPFDVVDTSLNKALSKARKNGRLMASSDISLYAKATIIIIDINLDLKDFEGDIKKSSFLNSIRQIANHMNKNAFLLVETTVPPGTCEHIIIPEIRKTLIARSIPSDKFYLAHSYERVMPGKSYFNSIKNYWRVYAGLNKQSEKKCKIFLETIINTDKYPLTKLNNLRASELSKIMENTFRASSIALMDEWGKFSKKIGVDLFSVVDAIKLRPTHKSIMYPGLGVGGYCLTKDPLFGEIAAKKIFKLKKTTFPVSRKAVEINNKMPLHAIDILLDKFDDNINGVNILLLGVAYKSEVGDTRYSPSEIFYKSALKKGANIDCHDPYLDYWKEIKLNINKKLNSFMNYQVVVLAVAHPLYLKLDYKKLIGKNKLIFLDTNNILTKKNRNLIRLLKSEILSVGR